jgi:hypothetical protein
MSAPPCKTCEHRRGSGEFMKCDATGYYASTERKHGPCGPQSALWTPRRGFKRRMFDWWNGVTATDTGRNT